MPGITKGYKITGGAPSNVGEMADAGTVGRTNEVLRAKSSSINKIPGAQMILDAKKFAAEEEAETMRTKAEWDADALAAKYDYYADAAKSKGQSAQLQGFVGGGLGLGMSAFNLFSGKKGGDDTGDDTTSTPYGTEWSSLETNKAFNAFGGTDWLDSLNTSNPYGIGS